MTVPPSDTCLAGTCICCLIHVILCCNIVMSFYVYSAHAYILLITLFVNNFSQKLNRACVVVFLFTCCNHSVSYLTYKKPY